MYRQNAAPKNASNSNNGCIYLGSLGSVTTFKAFLALYKVSLVTPALLAFATLLKQE
jgi:hypothetical protein